MCFVGENSSNSGGRVCTRKFVSNVLAKCIGRSAPVQAADPFRLLLYVCFIKLGSVYRLCGPVFALANRVHVVFCRPKKWRKKPPGNPKDGKPQFIYLFYYIFY